VLEIDENESQSAIVADLIEKTVIVRGALYLVVTPARRCFIVAIAGRMTSDSDRLNEMKHAAACYLPQRSI